MKEGYCLEIDKGKKTDPTATKRTFGFFHNAIKTAREHILELYNLDTVPSKYRSEAEKVNRDYRKNSKLETSLATILCESIKEDEDKFTTVYFSDMTKRIRKEDDPKKVYAFLRGSADNIMVNYGFYSKPDLEFLQIMASCYDKKFTQGKRGLSLDDLMYRAITFYKNAAHTAADISKKYDSDAKQWEKKTESCILMIVKSKPALELLRTVHLRAA